MSEEIIKNDSNELITREGSYAVTENIDVLTEALSELTENCQGLTFTLDRVKIPAGGGTVFEIPSPDGEDSTEAVKEITGVIVYHHPCLAYYKEKYTGGNNPPECGSYDGITGIGTPGGSCADCPYNRFGSGEGKGKLCKNRRLLYIETQSGGVFPIRISLPTGSLKAFTNYLKSQLSRGRKLSQVETKITLKKAVNANGIAFSQAVFTFVRMLDADEIKTINMIADAVKVYAANQTPASMIDIEPIVDPETGEVVEPLK